MNGGVGTAGTTGAAGVGGGSGTTGAAGTGGASGTTGTAGTGGGAGTTGASGSIGSAGSSGVGGSGPSLVVKIDAGGTAASSWGADTDFTGGSNGPTNNGVVDVTGVVNPAPQTVYQTTRIGAFTYTVPGFSTGTTRRIRLHFCETYFPPPGDTMSGVGRRLCTISINGGRVLDAFDIL
jgi:hypothetical protein